MVRILSSTADRALSRGDNATLSCSARCSLHQPTVTWFKDGHKLSESGPALQLHHVTAEDSGNYTCSLNTRDSQRSPPYSLQVTPEEDPLSGQVSQIFVDRRKGDLMCQSGVNLSVRVSSG